MGLKLRNRKVLNNDFDDTISKYVDEMSESSVNKKIRDKIRDNEDSVANNIKTKKNGNKIKSGNRKTVKSKIHSNQINKNFKIIPTTVHITGDGNESIDNHDVVGEPSGKMEFEMTVDPGDDDLDEEDNLADDFEDDQSQDDETVEQQQPIEREAEIRTPNKPSTSHGNVRRRIIVENKEKVKTPVSSHQQRMAEFERLKKLPDVQQFLQLMKDDEKPTDSSVRGLPRPKLTRGNLFVGNQNHKNIISKVVLNKSPSDSTVYTPALRHKHFNCKEFDKFKDYDLPEDHVDVDDRISECIDQLRMKDFPDDRNEERLNDPHHRTNAEQA